MNIRSPSNYSPFKSTSRSKPELAKFASPFLSYVQRSNASVTSFNDSIVNFRKEVRNAKNADAWEPNRWKTSMLDQRPARSPRSQQSPAKINAFKKVKPGRSNLMIEDIMQSKPVKNKSLLSSQLKIEQVFRQGSPRQLPTFTLNKGDPNPWGKPHNHVEEVRRSNSRDRGAMRFKSQDTQLDTELRIQRNSLERKLRSDNSWWNDFNSLRVPSPQRIRMIDRTEQKVPLQDVLKLTSKLGEITSNDIPKLSISYISELSGLQDTLNRIIREANKTRR